MSRPRLRALVLAAGRGERLRPLTDVCPKPLLPVAGEPIAAWSLSCLADIGCEGAALNLFHLGDRLRAHFGISYHDMPLTYSRETELMGTLGALAPLRSYLSESKQFVVLNGDSLCRWPLAELLAHHRRSGSAATLLLATRPEADAFGGGVGVDAEGRVVSLRPGRSFGQAVRRAVFAGAHVLDRALLERVPEGPGDIVSGLYEPLLAEGGTIAALLTDRPWHDLGTPSRYLTGALELGLPRLGRSWRSTGAIVDRGGVVHRSLLETGSVVERDALVEESLLLPGASVGSGAKLHRVIVGHGAAVPPGTVLREVMVTRRLAPPSGSEDDLVLTPFAPSIH